MSGKYPTVAVVLCGPIASRINAIRKVFRCLLKQHREACSGSDCPHSYSGDEVTNQSPSGKRCSFHSTPGGRQLRGTIDSTYKTLNVCTHCGVRLTFKFSSGFEKGVDADGQPVFSRTEGCPGSPFVIVNVSDATLFHTREDLLEKELLSEAAGVDLVVDGFRLGNFMEVNADGSQVLRLHQHHFEELVAKFKRAAGDMDWRMFLSHNDRMGEVFTDGSKEAIMFGELTAKEAEVVVIQALEAWLNVELSADHLQRRKGVRAISVRHLRCSFRMRPLERSSKGGAASKKRGREGEDDGLPDDEPVDALNVAKLGGEESRGVFDDDPLDEPVTGEPRVDTSRQCPAKFLLRICKVPSSVEEYCLEVDLPPQGCHIGHDPAMETREAANLRRSPAIAENMFAAKLAEGNTPAAAKEFVRNEIRRIRAAVAAIETENGIELLSYPPLLDSEDDVIGRKSEARLRRRFRRSAPRPDVAGVEGADGSYEAAVMQEVHEATV